MTKLLGGVRTGIETKESTKGKANKSKTMGKSPYKESRFKGEIIVLKL